MEVKFEDLEIGDSIWTGQTKSGTEYIITALDKEKEEISGLKYVLNDRLETVDTSYATHYFHYHRKNKVTNWKKVIEDGL